MKNKVITLFIIFVFTLSLAPISIQAEESNPVVYLEVPQIRSTDKEFEISVKTVETIQTTGVFSYSLKINFEKKLLKAIAIDGIAVNGIEGYKNIDNDKGTIQYLYSLNDTDISDKTLAKVKFQILSVGTATVYINNTSKFYKKDNHDGSATTIDVNLNDTSNKSTADIKVSHLQAPSFSYPNNSIYFVSSVTVRLSSTDDNADIYYTTSSKDKDNPTIPYSDQIRLSSTATIWAVAEKDGVKSTISSQKFTKVQPQQSDGGGGSVGSGATIVSIPVISENQKYADISNHWSKQYFEKLIEKGIINGYEDGTLRPDNLITRAEAAKLIVSAIGLSPSSNTELNFSDSSEIADWAKNYIQVAVEKGIITGYEDNTFKPNQNVSRKELVVLAIRAFSLNGGNADELTFADSNSIPDWAAKSVATALKYGILSGYADNTFKPDNFVTRGESSKIILSCLEL